jgi:alpha-ribazole phosphatase
MELNFGIWEQKCWDDIETGTLKMWTADVVNRPCPGGESYRDQFQRAVAFWQDASATHDDRVAVVAHGGLIRALLAYLLDIPLEKSLRIGIDFGGVTKIHLLDDVPIIDYINR